MPLPQKLSYFSYLTLFSISSSNKVLIATLRSAFELELDFSCGEIRQASSKLKVSLNTNMFNFDFLELTSIAEE